MRVVLVHAEVREELRELPRADGAAQAHAEALRARDLKQVERGSCAMKTLSKTQDALY